MPRGGHRHGRSREEVLEDYDVLRRRGFTVREAADEMGMSYEALSGAIYRAKLDGDPRAVRIYRDRWGYRYKYDQTSSKKVRGSLL